MTLGVEDLHRSRSFYRDGLGWPLSGASNDGIAFFQTGGVVLALYPWRELAEDAAVPGPGPAAEGFRGFTLAHNVPEREQVDAVLREAEAAGARIAKPAEEVFWGGYSGYFTDPDDHLWEVAWNPGFPLDEAGNLVLPE